MARAKQFYLCNLIPLWEIDDEHLQVDWMQSRAFEDEIVEMHVLASGLPLQVEPWNFALKLEIYENDFLLSGWTDDHTVTISTMQLEGERVEQRALRMFDADATPPLDQKLQYIYTSTIEGDEDQRATLVRAYWRALLQDDTSGDPEYYFDITLSIGENEFVERSDRELTVSPSQAVPVIVQTRERPEVPAEPLSLAWVYMREGEEIRQLRTDTQGRVFAPPQDANRSHPWEYTSQFTARLGEQIELYYSRGYKPIPSAILNAHPAVFLRRQVSLADDQANTDTPEGQTVRITLPQIHLRMVNPVELSLWSLLWQLAAPAYLTDGIVQGGAAWVNPNAPSHLQITDHGPAAPAPPDAQPGPRGLTLQGEVDANATAIRIKVLNQAGNAVALRQTPAANVQEIAAALEAPSGATRSFRADILFADLPHSFGPVQILVSAEGTTPPIVEAYYVHLCGMQLALVNDYEANPSGLQRGPIRDQTDEVNVVDFLDSPQGTMAALSAQTRVRRMESYRMANRQRLSDPSVPAGPHNPQVLKPEMPMWMAELQLIGLSQVSLQELMAYRYFARNAWPVGVPAPASLRFEIGWRLTLSWDGPDSNSAAFAGILRHNQAYGFLQNFDAREVVQLYFGERGQFVDANMTDLALTPQDEVPGAITPAPARLPFPVAGRRLPQVVARGQNRAWGRQAGAPQEAMLIEFQPRVTDAAGTEIIRGGDGVLEIRTMSVDNRPLEPGRIPQPDGTFAAPPAADSLLRLPEFRGRGLNPVPHAAVQALISALVENHYDAHNAQPHVALLPLACWQETASRIFQHENGADQQFDSRPDNLRRRRYRRLGNSYYYGLELDMPLFGPPHGYGFGQLDSPPVDDDSCWSFFENIRRAVRQIFDMYGQGAYNHISAHIPVPPNQRIRAVYQRELVRRYNGGREFQWNAGAGDWEVHPSLNQWANPANHAEGPNPRLRYPNRVLGTHVVYYVGAGAATNFPWPISYTPANYGPGT